MEICYLGPDSMMPGQEEEAWECKLMEGAWKRNVNAGGCRNYPSEWLRAAADKAVRTHEP